VTPLDCVEHFLDAWTEDIGFLPSGQWLDPCAGGDNEHPMTYPSVLSERGIFMDTIDIREDSPAATHGNYLEMPLETEPYVIMTNPPFYLAKEIIEKALVDVRDGGYVVMLLRLNFFGSKARFPFFQQHPPLYTYVHHRRMSFTDDGKTDSIEYMHAVWKKGADVTHTKLKVL
jgi:hypothetical protein